MTGPILEYAHAARIALEQEPESCRKILFLGEDNPQSSNPEYALYPYPERCAGERLCNNILRVDEDVYLACYRTNLCHDGSWSLKKARQRAELLLHGDGRPWEVIVALGAKVAKIVGEVTGHELKPFQAVECAAGYVVYLPHPSGRNLAYNHEAFRDKARDLVKQFCPDLWP